MAIENILLTDIRGTQYANKIRRAMFAIGKKYGVPKEEILKTAGRINVAIYNLMNKKIDDYKKTIHILSGIEPETIDNITVLRRINIDISSVIEIDEENKTIKVQDVTLEVKFPIVFVTTEKLTIPDEVTNTEVENMEKTQE